MARAEIHGPHASAKGLRHGFGVLAVEQGIPLPLIQQWMGHADLESTVVYTMVMPHETRSLAARLWNDPLLTR
jgi:site-specific recombinase XerD